MQENRSMKLHQYTDILGRSVLQKAVRSGIIHIVDALLDCCHGDDERYAVIHHAILIAIEEDEAKILKHLLQHQDTIR